MKTKYKYYFGAMCGVYAVDESKPEKQAGFFDEGDWHNSASTNENVVQINCLPETPVTIKQILKKYPNFKPLE